MGSIIVPALNEAGSIGAVIDEVRAEDPGFEVVVIDDGSTDHTAEAARARSDRPQALIQRRDRRGGADRLSVRARTGFDIAVQVDGDGQHDPGEIADC